MITFILNAIIESSKELAIKSFTSDFYLGKSTWNTLTSFCFVPWWKELPRKWQNSTTVLNKFIKSSRKRGIDNFFILDCHHINSKKRWSSTWKQMCGTLETTRIQLFDNFETPRKQLWHKIDTTLWELCYKFETISGLLWDNFDKKLTQLSLNFDTKLTQLWENFDTSLRQSRDYFETTLTHLSINFNPTTSKRDVTQLWQIFETSLTQVWQPGDNFGRLLGQLMDHKVTTYWILADCASSLWAHMAIF